MKNRRLSLLVVLSLFMASCSTTEASSALSMTPSRFRPKPAAEGRLVQAVLRVRVVHEIG